MKFIGYTVITILVVVFSTIFNGYALSVLWNWFIIPTFDVSSINTVEGIGIAMVAVYLTHQIRKEDAVKNEKEYVEALLNILSFGITKPLLFLFLGYIVHLFM